MTFDIIKNNISAYKVTGCVLNDQGSIPLGHDI
jgi:hypothetical protein